MKTKSLVIVVFLISCFESAFSQTYYPLLRNSSWLLVDWTSDSGSSEEWMIDRGVDVLVGSHTYQKFLDPYPVYDSNGQLIHEVFLREDLDAQKVYKIVDGVDMLLYDFSLENGNTIVQYGVNFIAAVDAVTVSNGSRKRITLTSVEDFCGEYLTQVWIEGVGSTKHPLNPDHNMYSVCSSSGGMIVRTKCSFQNDEHVYGEANCVSPAGLGTSDLNNDVQNIQLFPNPFVTELSIRSNIAFTALSIKVYNSVGQMVQEVQNQSGHTINLQRGDLSKGLYFIQLFEEGRLVNSTKVIID